MVQIREYRPLSLIGKTVFVLTIVYVMMNRIVPDLMVLPIGISLRPYEVVLLLAVGTWLLWNVTEPQPFPKGLVGVVGLAVLATLTFAPFLHALGMSPYQTNGAERGLFRIFLLAGLFMIAYQLAYRLRYAKSLLAWVVAAAVFQAVLGVWEFVTKQPLTFMFDLSRSFGLVFDPNAIRSELASVFSRSTGELRATATAPHPIVLSAVIALSVLIVTAWLVYSEKRSPRIWLMIGGAILVVSLPVANSRTAFVIIAFAALPLAILTVRELPRILPWSLALLLVVGVSFAISPQTPRLLLDSVTRSGQDENTQIRIERYERIPELLAPHPILGTGYLSHDPDIQIFDNSYLTGLIEFGILGLVFILWWFLVVLVRCWTGVQSALAREKVLPVAGVLAVIALLAGSGTFDALTFDQFLPMCLIAIGLGVGRSDAIARRSREVHILDVSSNDVPVKSARTSVVDVRLDDLVEIRGVGPVRARKLADAGIYSIAAVAATDAEELAAATDSWPSVTSKWIKSAKSLL